MLKLVEICQAEKIIVQRFILGYNNAKHVITFFQFSDNWIDYEDDFDYDFEYDELLED